MGSVRRFSWGLPSWSGVRGGAVEGYRPNNRTSRKGKAVIAIVAIVGLVLLWFLRTLHLKFTHPYEGRHHFNNVRVVGPAYHPSDSAWTPEAVKNRAWWNARMNRQQAVKYLFMPLRDFWEHKEEQYRLLLEWYGREYRWLDLPVELWPEAWSVPSIDFRRMCMAGSDVPPRALAAVEQLKPFQITVGMRLAAA